MSSQLTYNFSLVRGDTWQWSTVLKDAAGALLDVTGYTARLMVRQAVGASTPSVSISEVPNTQGEITITGASGKFEVLVKATATASLPTGRNYYDLEVTSPAPDSIVTTILRGELEVVADVTRT